MKTYATKGNSKKKKKLIVKHEWKSAAKRTVHTFCKCALFFHYLTNLTGLDFNLLLQDDNYKLQAKLPLLARDTVSFLSFEAKWLLYAPPGSTLKISTLCPQAIYVTCTDLRTNS
jgi:hypothetical protein